MPFINWLVGSLDHVLSSDMTSTADNSTVIVTAFFDYQFNHIINAKGVDVAKENLSMLIDHVLLTLNFNGNFRHIWDR